MDSAQSHFSCSCMLGVILGMSSYSVCMDSAQYLFSCPVCRVSISVSVLILYVWTLHSPISPVLYARCHSRYLSLFCMYGLCTVPLLQSLYAGCHSRYVLLFCMYGLCTVPLLQSCMPGVILSTCPYSVCMDSAQYHFSCPVCQVSFSVCPLILYVWTLHSPTSPVLYAGLSFSVCPLILYVWTLHSPTCPVLDAGCHSWYAS
ncbi:unnamed protein product [Staurois parvus]|uniref:Uncharacterized protein n=1 Tax=Staurois parvus TaxID=386267 RepID=A0ABN9EZZ1_9NEOB|nr:unnamed protein product [Staurois parvus]